MLNHKVSASFFYDPHPTCCMICFCNTYPLDIEVQIMYGYIMCLTRILANYAPCCNIVVESISKFVSTHNV